MCYFAGRRSEGWPHQLVSEQTGIGWHKVVQLQLSQSWVTCEVAECLYISNTLHTFIPFNNKYFTILDTPRQYWTVHIGIKWKMISTFYPLSLGWCPQKLCLCLLASSPWLVLQSILLEPTELFARRLWLWSLQPHIPRFAYLKYKDQWKIDSVYIQL